MSGKAYTMKEMKAIVDYLIERKAYGEIKGRKMWVDFEKSKFTNRTWQSLKETFLKRILPDIHNPYYQLSLVQITSFRQGYDVEAKLNNKLEIRTVSEGSSSDAVQPENTEQPSTSNTKDGENASGEEIINSKPMSHHRASTETVILEPCYETVEEIQRDLESPKQDLENLGEKDNNKSPPKTLRDFITYSEPLTPMLQEVIDDFATDEERDISDDEPQMEIAEDVENDKVTKKINDSVIDKPVEINTETDDVTKSKTDAGENIQDCDSNQDDKNNTKENGKPLKNSEKVTDNTNQISTQNIIEIEDSEELPDNCKINDNKNDKKKDFNKIVPSDNESKIILETGAQDKPKEIDSINVGKVTFSQDTCTQNFSNTTTDTLIPNNQEALGTKSNPADKIGSTDLNCVNKNPKKHTGKRANSQEPMISKRKRRPLVSSSKSISVSDTDASNKRGQLNTNITKSVSANHKQRTEIDIKDSIDKIENHTNQNPKVTENEEETNENNEDIINEKTNNQTNKNNEIVACNEDKNVIDLDIENPCLKSVSLYDEQFTSMKYSDSSDDISAKKTHDQKKINAPKKQMTENKIVLLKSNSEGENHEVVKKKKASPARNLRSERDSVLANVFGFSRGAAVSSNRKRRISYQNRIHSQSHNKASSGSSEWTSETEAEFVSPPRGRRNRHTRKYLKPRPARILSLEEEGGLFVMYGKKIYPVVKDGKIMKNYVTYAPERDSEDEEESFWKLKYIEEKKRTAQLTKLLNQTTNDDRHSLDGGASFDQNSSPKKRKLLKKETETQENNTVQEVAPKEHVEPPKSVTNDEKTLKIKITKQNEEVQLEGHWSQIHPVLDQVVQIFHKEIEHKSSFASVAPSPQMEQKKISSGMSTPVTVIPMDQEVHDKINKLETEIFQEIEALDKQEVLSPPKPLPSQEPQVTKKRGRPRKSAPAVPENPEKKQIKGETEKLPVQENLQKPPPIEIENNTSPVTRKTRSPKKVLHESTERNESNVINTRTKRTKESLPAEQVDDEAVRYKFPSPPPSGKKTNRKSGANKTTKEQKTRNRYVKKTGAIFSSPDNISMNSIESSQGYQDSDISPIINLRKKKKVATTYYNRGKYTNRIHLRRRTHWWRDDMSDQSSNSCPDFNHNNSLSGPKSSSDIYRSESYQLLMPKTKNSFNHLAKIDEVKTNDHVEILPSDANVDIHVVDDYIFNSSNVHKEQPNIANSVTDIENSSNVSLPTSPVLSIVENISISSNALNINDDMDKENTNNHPNVACNSNDYKITDVDITMPLMQQDCGIQTTVRKITDNQKYNLNNLPTVITESFIDKICTVNIEDNSTLSETINRKLRNLLLESAKKLAQTSQLIEGAPSDKMDIDSTQAERVDKTKAKKRCSTPLKRRGTRKKLKRPEVEQFIEEEHTESCSHNGRKSCPPMIQIPSAGLHTETVKETGDAILNRKKGRKKKENVIKVKILRPKVRKSSKESEMKHINQKGNEESAHGDSGINDTISSVLLQGQDDSVDLIHNHSETCLQANDCVGDSVVYIENSTNSVITLDTNSDQSMEMERQCQIDRGLGQDYPIEMYNTDRGETFSQSAIEMMEKVSNNEFTTYHTPMNSVHTPSSLITEDLSDPELEAVGNRTSRPSNWYLFSDDETTNNAFPINTNSDVGFGADLNALFPVTCAIPDLSTITEMSNDKAPGSERGSRNDSFP